MTRTEQTEKTKLLYVPRPEGRERGKEGGDGGAAAP